MLNWCTTEDAERHRVLQYMAAEDPYVRLLIKGRLDAESLGQSTTLTEIITNLVKGHDVLVLAQACPSQLGFIAWARIRQWVTPGAGHI